jgi:hypothetical protein
MVEVKVGCWRLGEEVLPAPPEAAEAYRRARESGWPASLLCHEESCPMRRECVHHETAGDFRSESGAWPGLDYVGGKWLCTQRESQMDYVEGWRAARDEAATAAAREWEAEVAFERGATTMFLGGEDNSEVMRALLSALLLQFPTDSLGALVSVRLKRNSISPERK